MHEILLNLRARYSEMGRQAHRNCQQHHTNLTAARFCCSAIADGSAALQNKVARLEDVGAVQRDDEIGEAVAIGVAFDIVSSPERT